MNNNKTVDKIREYFSDPENKVLSLSSRNVDFYGWDSAEDRNLRKLHQFGIKGFIINHSVSFGVNDWIIEREEDTITQQVVL